MRGLAVSESWLEANKHRIAGLPRHKSKPKKNKYGAVKKEVDGIQFDSTGEADRYIYLKMLEASGEIKELTLQPAFTLQHSFRHKGKLYRAIKYKADFRYLDTFLDKEVVEDFKGKLTETFKIKMKMFMKQYSNYYVFRISKKKASSFITEDF